MFLRLQKAYYQHDELIQVVAYRQHYLSLMIQGEDSLESLTEDFIKQQSQTQSDYEEAEGKAKAKIKILSEDDQQALKVIWKKLVHLFHPDRHNQDPEKREVYERLTAKINILRDDGDLATLKEIATDPDL